MESENLIQQVLMGESMSLILDLPAQSVDMILTDPPYGTTVNKWDTIIPYDILWGCFEHIIKPGGAIVMTSVQPFTSTLAMSNIKAFKYEWVWLKENASNFLNAKIRPLIIHENVLVFCLNGSPPYYPQELVPCKIKGKHGGISNNYGVARTEGWIQEWTNYPQTILQFKRDNPKQHPTQKPVALFEYLIRTYTKEGEIVLDPFAGSGTTGVAAKNTGRSFILMEQEQKYIDIINQRLNVENSLPAASSQLSLL